MKKYNLGNLNQNLQYNLDCLDMELNSIRFFLACMRGEEKFESNEQKFRYILEAKSNFIRDKKSVIDQTRDLFKETDKYALLIVKEMQRDLFRETDDHDRSDN